MIETIKLRLKNDKELQLLSLLATISVLAKIIAIIFSYSTYFPVAIQILQGLFSLVSPILFLLFIMLQYKTKQINYFKLTFILHFGALGINNLISIIYGWNSIVSLLGAIISCTFYICIFVFAIKGVKDIKVVKIICIAQIACTGLGTLVNFINIYGNIFVKFLSILFGCGATVLFWIIILKIAPSIIKVRQNKMHSVQTVLEELKLGFDSGIITKEEYNQKKTEILNKL